MPHRTGLTRAISSTSSRGQRFFMVEKQFWNDPYQRELETRIASIDGTTITVAETIFFAFSGGQESDYGTIAGRNVVGAEKKGFEIFYTLENTDGLAPGDSVHMAIDWARRYQLMRLHFAAELVLELIYKAYPETTKSGAHIAQDKARIDFAWEGNITETFPLIQRQIETIINDNRTILCDFSDRAQERRYWKIQGFSEVPCGGTHVRATGEIGPVRLKRRNPGKGQERIEIYLEPHTP